IEDQMVVRLRDLDERRGAVQELVHVLARLGRHDHALLAPEKRDAAARAREVVAHLLERELGEHARVELPREAAGHLPERRARDVVDDERVLARLGRDETETRDRFLERRIDLRIAEALAGLSLLALWIRLSHRRVDDDRTSKSLAVHRGRDDTDEAAHAVADEHGPAREPRVRDDGEHFVGPLPSGVLLATPALAVTAQVERDDVVLAREHRREEGPPLGVGGAAVHEDEPGFDALSPAQVMNRTAGDLDEVVGARSGERLAK